ncbi:carboxymuconolactone decarboxylase family protein [Mycolicibacterium rufum]|uniref:Carboxymuconolactone decarboxylase family protein n=1 Tax=Mycolicibacterium rufum TaxID=318424 RepID=A0A9X2YGQ1_9MYCO|nr:carboxymuconolactone decarboxylase family protein [Mycolicibacterium rufum]KGI69160.1 carboxymuconolactone decarboxylase [Mycolicibacterium rufum]MCV7072945.1 carboxymuconolactone decarboxylase family protein [Mycolicibacterium rufum]ULP39625.1 carboxymuconolactone decarboxylase family protein [Mycolicibacterium rufum]
MTPLPADLWDDAVRDAVAPLLPAQRANPRDAGNILATLARHPRLMRAYLAFNAHLLVDSTLSPRVREVAVLRAVQRRASKYLWSHHVPLAERAGLTTADIEAIQGGAPVDVVDAVVVRAVDDVDEQNTVTETTWSALREHFDEQQVLDLLFTIGCYQTLAVVVNTLGVEPESG